MLMWDYDENGDFIDEIYQYRELNVSGSLNYNIGYRSFYRNYSDYYYEYLEDY